MKYIFLSRYAVPSRWKKNSLCIHFLLIPTLGKSGWTSFLMKFQTTSVRTRSFVHFILWRICFQTRHNSMWNFQKTKTKLQWWGGSKTGQKIVYSKLCFLCKNLDNIMCGTQRTVQKLTKQRQFMTPLSNVFGSRKWFAVEASSKTFILNVGYPF